MAVGNAIVNTVKFKPLTVAEWAAPLKEYADQHVAAEEALIKLGDEVTEYEQYIREHPNSIVAQQYQKYLNDIDNQVSNLAQYGITPQSRADLNTLRYNFKRNIQPVKNAVERFKADEKLIQADKSKGIIGKEHTLDNYLNDSTYSYSYITGDTVTADFARVYGQLAEATINAPEFQQKVGGSQYWQIMQSQGYNATDILNSIISNPDADPEIYNSIPEELKNAVFSLRSKYGYDSMGEDEKTLFNNYAYTGALAGLEKKSYNLQANRGYLTPSEVLASRKANQENKVISVNVQTPNGPKTYLMYNGARVEWDNKLGDYVYFNTNVPIGTVASNSTTPTTKLSAAQNTFINSIPVGGGVLTVDDKGEASFGSSDFNYNPADKTFELDGKMYDVDDNDIYYSGNIQDFLPPSNMKAGDYDALQTAVLNGECVIVVGKHKNKKNKVKETVTVVKPI